MLHLLGIALAVGAGAIIVNILESDADNDQRRYHSERKKADRRMRENAQHLQAVATRRQESEDFERLCNLHYKSTQIAQLAYNSLKKNQQISKGIGIILKKSQRDVSVLQKQLEKSNSKKKKQIIQKELDKNYVLLDECKKHKRINNKTTKELLNKLTQHNSETHQLKLQIRNECGNGGKLWYQRLEERSNQRNS